jgi:cyclopropane-fatty-acyl-phospholipid synthase
VKRTFQELLGNLSTTFPHAAFEVSLWDGETKKYGTAAPAFTLKINNEEAAKVILSRGSMGFREEYAAGRIDVEGDLQELLHLGIDVDSRGLNLSAKTMASIALQNITSFNTLKKAPGNIAHHYDLGNDFYKLYLDESMTYSCAYFIKDDDTLDMAQQQKYEHICRKLCLKTGDTLIDIGCGWGGMLIYAARHYGVQGVGCTLSRHQEEYARERVKNEGLEKEITILREDYRNINRHFDKFVSIGMFEHVGKRYISVFMEKAKRLLKPGGVGLLHTIGKEQNTPGDPWTMKYIFPGGYIPPLDSVVNTMGKKGLVPLDIENLRLHYARTLDEWAARFEANIKEIEKMFDTRFIRTWRMYLNGSAACFRWGDIRFYQILFSNGLNNSLPMTREHLYSR